MVINNFELFKYKARLKSKCRSRFKRDWKYGSVRACVLALLVCWECNLHIAVSSLLFVFVIQRVKVSTTLTAVKINV